MPSTERKHLVGHLTRSRDRAHGCLILFALPFVVIGGGIVGIAMGWIPLKGPPNEKAKWIMVLMGGVFFCAGLLLIRTTIAGKIREARDRARLRTDPLQPWLGDYAWNPEGDTSRVGRDVFNSLVALLFFCAFLAPFNFAFFPAIPILFFDLLLAAGWGWFIYFIVRSGKYGDSRLRYAAFPFFLGGPVVVFLEGIDRLKGLREMKINLRCIEEAIEVRASTRGSQSTTVCYSIWADERVLGPSDIPFGEGQRARFLSFARRDDATAALRFEALLPDDPRFGTDLAANPARYWEIEVKADTLGVDYAATFLVPVYPRPPGDLR